VGRSERLLALAPLLDSAVTVMADLPENISIGGEDRQPLLDVDPDVRAAEVTGDAPGLPRPFENETSTFRLGAEYVDPGATVLIDGETCEGCSFTPVVAPTTGKNAVDMTIDPGLAKGVHVVQVLNPNGWQSNEMPLCVTNVEFGRTLPPRGEETCRPNDMTIISSVGPNPQCGAGLEVQSCDCDPGANGMVQTCEPQPTGRRCNMTIFCFNGATCDDAVLTAPCGPINP
jgi:hypothetical protein